MINRHNRRLIVTKRILTGDEFIEGHNFGIYRALTDQPHALSPFRITDLSESCAKRDMNPGDGILESDI
jgi:hypothetical protein